MLLSTKDVKIPEEKRRGRMGKRDDDADDEDPKWVVGSEPIKGKERFEGLREESVRERRGDERKGEGIEESSINKQNLKLTTKVGLN